MLALETQKKKRKTSGKQYQRHKRFGQPWRRDTSHIFENTPWGREKQAQLKHQRLTEMKYHSPPPLGCLTHSDVSEEAKMLRLQPWETCQLHQHISFPLKRERGMRGWGVRGGLFCILGVASIPPCRMSMKSVLYRVPELFLLLCSFVISVPPTCCCFLRFDSWKWKRKFELECLWGLEGELALHIKYKNIIRRR